MQRVRVFLNRRASKGEKSPFVESLRRRLFRSELDFVEPDDAAALDAELDRAVSDKVDVVVSVGGDGTVNTLIQKLGGTDTGFLVVPAGTANDLARELGIYGSVGKAISAIRTQSFRHIDLIRINERFMVTNGGLGVAGEVASDINALRARFPVFKELMALLGRRVYSGALALRALSPRLQSLDIEVDSRDWSGRVQTSLLMINNQATIAGTFRVAPDTRNDDGLFNVTIFRHKSRTAFLKRLIETRQGIDPKIDPDVLSFETAQLRLQILSPQGGKSFFGDGEILARGQKFDLHLMPRALKVYTAQGSQG